MYTDRDLVDDLNVVKNEIINILENLGSPLKDDGGYVPSDDDQPTKLANDINEQLAKCQYYDGEAELDGPFRIWGRAQIWYADTLLIRSGGDQTAAVVNALLNWGQTLVSDAFPKYPGPKVGWRWENISLGSDWVVTVWITNGNIGVRAQ